MRKIILTILGSLLISDAIAQFPSTPYVEDSLIELIPGKGFKIFESNRGTLSFSPFITFRYLNQNELDTSYTNAFDKTSIIYPRNDVQFQKVTLYFKGWMMKPEFRYVAYIWTSNANLGQGAQVVLAGNLQYKINRFVDVGIGIGGVPTSRSLIGQWPLWLRQDARPMAEEFFRGSFTTGIWAQGEITKNIFYKTMIGNNLSQLGIDAGQLDNKFDTWGTSIWWTTNNFARLGSYGDFEKHEKPATMFGVAYTRSTENWQSQPGANAPENSQIRLSDGSGIFNPNAFPNSQIFDAFYQMSSINGGIKYKGITLDAEYFMRWLSDFVYDGDLPVSKTFDDGFSVQASGMLVDKTLQAYAVYSYINGEYGYPWEMNIGFNWFPFKNRIIRINPEYLYTHNSPVGYYSYPTVVGAKGSIVMVNLELYY